MQKDTRPIHISEIGITSEATKDSGDVGISSYLTATPNLTTIRGNPGVTDVANASWGELLSDTALLCPFSINDDAKRLNFAGIQAAHVIPIINSRAPYVRTGHEAIIPIKVKGRFVTIAEDNGVVKKVTSSSMKVMYEKLGEKEYPIYSWTTSKEESGSCYRHDLVPNLVEGDVFGKDDTLIYDIAFFEPDIFNRKRVVYKQGTMVKTAFIDDPDTYEDSGGISKRFCESLKTRQTKYTSEVISSTDNIHNLVKPGDRVEATTPLFSIADEMLSNLGDMDKRTLSILQELKMNTPKSKIAGIVNKVHVFYNCALEELSPTLLALATEADADLLKSAGHTGRVNSSYSIAGVPLLPNQVEVKVYIDLIDNMGLGDKAILANQLKFTVGTVADYEMTTESGEPIDLWFGIRSVSARIVNSAYLMGTTASTLDALKNLMVKTYKELKGSK